MMSFGQKKPAAEADERVIEVTKVENAEDRRERALEELSRNNPDFASRFDQAVKIVHDDRVMFIQHSNVPADQRPQVTYADARKAMMAMVARAGDQTVDGYKYVLEMAVQRVLSEGRRFNSAADVEKAFLTYASGGQG